MIAAAKRLARAPSATRDQLTGRALDHKIAAIAYKLRIQCEHRLNRIPQLLRCVVGLLQLLDGQADQAAQLRSIVAGSDT